VFSRLYVNMVRAGELGGTLHHTLSNAWPLYLERNQELRRAWSMALIYPVRSCCCDGGWRADASCSCS
jgi:general secretion pathway protein F